MNHEPDIGMNQKPDIIQRYLEALEQLRHQATGRRGCNRPAPATAQATFPLQTQGRRVRRQIHPAALRVLETTRRIWRRPLA